MPHPNLAPRRSKAKTKTKRASKLAISTPAHVGHVALVRPQPASEIAIEVVIHSPPTFPLTPMRDFHVDDAPSEMTFTDDSTYTDDMSVMSELDWAV